MSESQSVKHRVDNVILAYPKIFTPDVYKEGDKPKWAVSAIISYEQASELWPICEQVLQAPYNTVGNKNWPLRSVMQYSATAALAQQGVRGITQNHFIIKAASSTEYQKPPVVFGNPENLFGRYQRGDYFDFTDPNGSSIFYDGAVVSISFSISRYGTKNDGGVALYYRSMCWLGHGDPIPLSGDAASDFDDVTGGANPASQPSPQHQTPPPQQQGHQPQGQPGGQYPGQAPGGQGGFPPQNQGVPGGQPSGQYPGQQQPQGMPQQYAQPPQQGMPQQYTQQPQQGFQSRDGHVQTGVTPQYAQQPPQQQYGGAPQGQPPQQQYGGAPQGQGRPHYDDPTF